MTLQSTDRFATWDLNRKTLPGNRVYEISFKHPQSQWDKLGGYSIRFVEESADGEGEGRAIGLALADIFKYIPEDRMILPESTRVTHHLGWEELTVRRSLRELAFESAKRKKPKKEKAEKVTWKSLSDL